ncbi:Conserved_hypothetical protein [Hexamita inflata]|uniref:Major capsid protein n=1 Tax=Hexamita inflata TaxID=28002 RepID=A0AA86TXT4_9EUKA|nr:Conserved hypothetical protein [Hexamita inflata]
MSNEVNVVPAHVQQIENLGNTLYVSSSSDGVSINQQLVVKTGSGAVDTESNLRQTGGDVFQWQIQNIQKSTISTTASHIKYTMQFAIEFPVDKTNCGHYWVDKNILYRQKLVYASSGAGISYGPVEALCTTAMNSLFPIQEATVVYGNIQDTIVNVFRNSAYQQMYLPEDFQTTMNDQWFEGKNYIIDEYVLPFDEKTNVLLAKSTQWADGTHSNQNIIKKADGKLYWVFYKEFRIPLNMLHRVFNFSNNFFTAALYRDNMELQVKLQQHSMAKCFASDKIFSNVYTGICAFDLILQNKNSQSVQSDVQSKQFIIQNQIGIDVSPMSTSVKQLQEQQVTIGHQSVNAISKAFVQYDATESDSVYLHQRFTPFKAASIITYEQKRLDNCVNALSGDSTAYITQNHQQDFIFFSDFNIMRGDASKLFYTSNLTTLEQFRKEILRSTNSIQQYDRGLSPAFYTYFDWLCKYAFTFTNLEMFSMDEPSHDVIFDGYNSQLNKIIIRSSVKEYRNNKAIDIGDKTQLPINADFNTLQSLIYQFYDLQMKIDVKQGTLVLGEKFI